MTDWRYLLLSSGECAAHFGEILAKFPPQVSSRSAAAAWGCHVHNEVNKSLKKELWDCSNIGDFYDCGCADGDEDKSKTKKGADQVSAFRSPPLPPPSPITSFPPPPSYPCSQLVISFCGTPSLPRRGLYKRRHKHGRGNASFRTGG